MPNTMVASENRTPAKPNPATIPPYSDPTDAPRPPIRNGASAAKNEKPPATRAIIPPARRNAKFPFARFTLLLVRNRDRGVRVTG